MSRHYNPPFPRPHTQSLIKLALDHLTPDQGVLSLVSARSPLAHHLADSTHLESGPSRPSVEVLRILNVLSERARYSNQCCYVIITCFKLAVVSYLICVGSILYGYEWASQPCLL